MPEHIQPMPEHMMPGHPMPSPMPTPMPSRPFPGMPMPGMPMPGMPMPMPGHHDVPHAALVRTIQDCQATCEHMVHHLIKMHDPKRRMRQIQLLQDCADICGLTANYIARMSPFSKYIAEVCAAICEYCGNECLRHPDPESQRCGQICLHCARECRAFAAR